MNKILEAKALIAKLKNVLHETHDDKHDIDTDLYLDTAFERVMNAELYLTKAIDRLRR